MKENQKFEILIYKLYVFTLPLGQFLNIWMAEVMKRLFVQFSTIIMVVGVIVMLLNGRFRINNRTAPFFNLFFFMLVWSFLCSLVLIPFVPTNVMHPMVRLLTENYYFFIAVLSFIYNYHCLTHLVKFQSLYKIFDIQVVVIIITGFIQLAALSGFSGPYNALCTVFRLRELEWLMIVDRGVTLWADEPSGVSQLCFVLVPFIMTSLSHSKGIRKFFYFSSLLIFLLFFLLTLSSQTILIFVAVVLIYLFYIIQKRIPNNFYIISFITGFLSVSIYLVEDVKSVEVSGDSKTLEYAVVAKIFDRNNESTVIRVSTIINDLKLMAQFPLTGVGNGNQGYFYYDNVPYWVKKTNAYNEREAEHSIANGGGNFFPSYFSGFGLIGVVFLIIFLKKYRKCYQTSFLQEDERADVMFKLGTILFVFASWTVVDLRETIIFVFSLACVPLVKNTYKEIKNQVA